VEQQYRLRRRGRILASDRVGFGAEEQGDRASLFPQRAAVVEAVAAEWRRGVHDPDVFRTGHQGCGGGGGAGQVGERGEELGG